MMLNRRPNICERYPMIVPPVIAPKFATTWVTVTALAEKPYWLVSIVGYRSWLPCDLIIRLATVHYTSRSGKSYMKFMPAIKRTR
jgi:hypothetical protein